MIRTLPSWVEPDPLRGRAIDALGLQLTADKIADQILPGLSVLTRRARYYSLLCWARSVCGDRADERRIHRIEVALAIRESQLHDAYACSFKGLRNLKSRPRTKPPADPTTVYLTPAWREYRASMKSLGLLDQKDALTKNGAGLATAFFAACRPKDSSGDTALPKSACLSNMSVREANILDERLGISRLAGSSSEIPSERDRRMALNRELSKMLKGSDVSVGKILDAYEEAQTSPGTAAMLHYAAIWERLSVGLNALFLIRLHHMDTPSKAIALLKNARKDRARKIGPHQEIVVLDDDAATLAVRSIRKALSMRSKADPKDLLKYCDPGYFDLGEQMVGNEKPDQAFQKLIERHLEAKLDDAWIRPTSPQDWELARDTDDSKWALPERATLHGYRLMAFRQLRADILQSKRTAR